MIRPQARQRRRGVAAVTMVVVLVMLEIMVIGMVLSGGRDHDLTVQRMNSVLAFYAAEAGMNMAVREMMINFDDDGDGTVGSISNDFDDTNNPSIGLATVLVSRSDDATNATFRSTGQIGESRRVAEGKITLQGSGIPFEVDLVTASNLAQTVTLVKKYADAVIVCTLHYVNNTIPAVVRVDNVTATSFDLYLQNPGDGATPVADQVSYLVVEQGAWNINGVTFEAQRYTSTVTDDNNSWNGEAQSYLQTYTNPVVIGQVMSANDPFWSVFWCRGNSRTNPPSPTSLMTGKTVCEDSFVPRLNEDVGFIVFEDGSVTIGGVALDAQESGDTITGVGNSPPYSAAFNGSFSSAPQVVLVGQHAMDGNNGGWSVIYGTPGASTTQVDVAIDEDQISDSERSHTNEQVAVVAFEQAGAITPSLVTWAEVEP